ncbi:MAG: HD domain-containing protein [Eubacterium sp.]|nr:HD domain-containing protein [Eubacterium sp.]
MDILKEYRKRRRERMKRLYEQHKRIHALLKEHAEDILKSENFRGTRRHIQHGSMTVYNHCLDVARYSLLLNRKFGLNCNKHDLIRGALLHDYFLYDWHDKTYLSERRRLHGFWHPGIALRNAEKEYQLNDVQREIIKKHMWPLSVVPPTCREAWVVTAADKYCSLMETVGLHKGHGARAS